MTTGDQSDLSVRVHAAALRSWAKSETGDQSDLSVRVHAAALYVALLKAGLFDEATEFAEWYLDTFDHNLED